MTREAAGVACGDPGVEPIDAAAGHWRERFGWAVRIRWLTIAGFLLLGMVAWAIGVLLDPAPFIAAALGASLLNLVNQAAVQRWRFIAAATLAAVVGDVLLITLLVTRSGGAQSPFVAMYAVQILAAALLVELRVALACAAAAVGALVFGVAWAGPAGGTTGVVAAPLYFPTWATFFAFGLGLVAYVGGHVSEQLRRREGALEKANGDLRDAVRSVEAGNREMRATCSRLAVAEGQLAQSEKMRALGDFVAGVVHELNNPIAIVAANLQILELEWSGDQRASVDGNPVGEALQDCAEAVGRAARIVSDLRRFSRAGGTRQWGEIDLHEHVTRTVGLARHLFGTGVEIRLDLQAAAPVIRAVAAEIDQLLLNLLGNAAQATGNTGTVSVSTARNCSDGCGRESIALRVADDGPGVPAHLADRVFEPFFTTRPEGVGVGLGLSLAFAIAERHGGAIRVDTSVRRGACFEVTLPVARGVAQSRGLPRGDAT